jgi:hypothetical protein
MSFFNTKEDAIEFDRLISYGKGDDDWGDHYNGLEERMIIKNCSNCEHPRNWCTCSEAEKRAMRRKARQLTRSKKNDKLFNR